MVLTRPSSRVCRRVFYTGGTALLALLAVATVVLVHEVRMSESLPERCAAQKKRSVRPAIGHYLSKKVVRLPVSHALPLR